MTRCVRCFRVVDVQPANAIVMQDEGIRGGRYYAVYCLEQARPHCARCRRRIAAMGRLIGMWQRRGDDVQWLGKPPSLPATRREE